MVPTGYTHKWRFLVWYLSVAASQCGISVWLFGVRGVLGLQPGLRRGLEPGSWYNLIS